MQSKNNYQNKESKKQQKSFSGLTKHPSNPQSNQPSNQPHSYYYQCSTCHKKFESDFIEGSHNYICPECDKNNQKGMPLKGVLQIFYDYEKLKRKYSHSFINKITPGNIFAFSDLLPLKNNVSETFRNLNLPPNSLKKVFHSSPKELYILDETHNPTFSYKDRASVLVAAKAMELGKDTICAASTGNAASSISGICAAVGLNAKIFVPNTIPEEKLIQIKIYGADVEKINGDYDKAFDLAIEASHQNCWYNRNTAFNPLTIEGKKSGAYDIYLQNKGKMPDKIFVPVGDGVIISGIYKGFYDLLLLGLIDKIPQLIAIQAENSSAIIDYLQTQKFKLKKASTLADSISVNAPRNLYLAAESIQESGGFSIKVSDEAILHAEKHVGSKLGIFIEPAAAAAWAGYEKYMESNKNNDEKIVVLITGCGLKDAKNARKIVEEI